VSNVVSLEQVLAAVRRRWGAQSIARLERAAAASPADAGAASAAHPYAGPGLRAAEARPGRRPARREREHPPWWPVAVANGAVLRPRSLEVVGEAGSGRLALALAWMAAAQPALAAVVDCAGRAGAAAYAGAARGGAGAAGAAGAARFYPPAAVSAGLPAERLVVVHPPCEEPRAALDAVTLLLRSEAFDVVFCPLPPGVRIGLTYGSKLAMLAARSGTTLLLLTEEEARGKRQEARLPPTHSESWTRSSVPGPRAFSGALAAFAEYRVRLVGRRWLWEDGELAGLRLRAATERARHQRPTLAGGAWSPGGGNDLGGALLEYDLTLRLHRSVRHGPLAPCGASGAIDGAPDGIADRFYLEKVTRVAPQPAAAPVAPAAPAAGGGGRG
jgi:hypothetical protein